MKEWYLIGNKTKPNMTGGYETDAFNSFKDDAFDEALLSGIGHTVEMFDSAMNKLGMIDCIIQDNIVNTQLKSLERTILTRVGTLRAGMYILFENRFWLVTGYPGNNGIYEKATLALCQYKLKWQKNDGAIIERWGNFTSASKYDIGESGNSTILLGSNNFTILISEDNDSATLEGKRVFIDRDILNPKKVFKITRSDDVLYLFGESHGGILSFIADKTEFNEFVDRPDLGLCDYISFNEGEVIDPNLPITHAKINAEIDGNKYLKIGFPRTYSVKFKDDKCNEIHPEFSWNIVSDFEVQQESTENGNIKISVDDENLVTYVLYLQVIVNNVIVAEKEIIIAEGF